MNWYIVQAYSGFEKKVVETIKDTLTKSKLESHLGEILVPTQEVTEVKKGKRTKKQKKYFPGYILVQLNLTKEVYHSIKNIQKVSGFLGSGDKPTPISDQEIQRILGSVSHSFSCKNQLKLSVLTNFSQINTKMYLTSSSNCDKNS